MVKIVANNPYISILKLKSSLVDVSVVAVTCAVLGTWDIMAVVATIAGIMIHSGCDIMNDIYDIEIDKICKPDGAISSGQMTLKNAWMYMLLLFLAALIISLTMGTILFTCLLTGIVLGGILYSHPKFRLKDTPGMGMVCMAVCFALESIGVWSIYSPINTNGLIVAAYVFVLVFSLTFMKDFKDVAGDVNSLPLALGIRPAARVCSIITVFPLIPLIYVTAEYHYLALAIVMYIFLASGCIKILLNDPVVEGQRLKERMVLTLTVPNYTVFLFTMASTL